MPLVNTGMPREPITSANQPSKLRACFRCTISSSVWHLSPLWDPYRVKLMAPWTLEEGIDHPPDAGWAQCPPPSGQNRLRR